VIKAKHTRCNAFNKQCNAYIDFISTVNIFNNIVNLTYGPQTITIATHKKHKQILKVKKSDPEFGVLTNTRISTVYLYSS